MPDVSPFTWCCRQGTGSSRNVARWNSKVDRGQFGV